MRRKNKKEVVVALCCSPWLQPKWKTNKINNLHCLFGRLKGGSTSAAAFDECLSSRAHFFMSADLTSCPLRLQPTKKHVSNCYLLVSHMVWSGLPSRNFRLFLSSSLFFFLLPFPSSYFFFFLLLSSHFFLFLLISSHLFFFLLLSSYFLLFLFISSCFFLLLLIFSFILVSSYLFCFLLLYYSSLFLLPFSYFFFFLLIYSSSFSYLFYYLFLLNSSSSATPPEPTKKAI